MKSNIVIPLVLIASLAACGGSGGSSSRPGGSGDNPPIPSGNSYNALVEQENALLTKYYENNFDFDNPGAGSTGPQATKPANMPSSGKATYKGVVAFGSNRTTSYHDAGGKETVSRSEPDYNGKVRLNADFAKNTISGKADSFKSAGNKPMAGSLNISGGQIEKNGFNGAKVRGNLTLDGASRKVTDGFASGDFIGKKANAVDGSLLIFRETASGGTKSESGTFIAEK